ncbi:MAG: SDR family oxidoreductase [Dehalococcoidia bacterium]|nr:SDR family oxidoreductase [Dehalococcoidia bacterium]
MASARGQMQISGKTAIITGAGSGIGRACAVRLAREGASVVVADVNDSGAAETVSMIAAAGGAAAAVQVDVTRHAEIDAMFAFARQTYGGFDILHNNAGIGTGQPRFPDCPEEQWMRVIDVDLIGVIEGIRKAIPLLRQRGGGVIISTASMAGLFGFAADPVYTAAKHGVVGITRALAGLKDEGIRVNCVCPGVVNTPMVTGARERLTGEARAQMDEALRRMPMIAPEDIAQGVYELITDDEAAGYAMGIMVGQPRRIVPPPVGLPGSSGGLAAPRAG